MDHESQGRTAARRYVKSRLGRYLGIALVAAFVIAGGLSASEAGRLAVSKRSIDDVLLTPDDIVVAPGGSQVLVVLELYDDGTTADKTDDYTIEVRDDDVAWVDENGVLHGLSEGRSHIDVYDYRGSRAGDGGDVEVPKITQIVIEPQTQILEEGATQQLFAFATLENGWSGIDVTEFVRWTSGKRSVATVGDEDGGPHGLVTAIRTGDARIRAKDPESGAQSSSEEGLITVVPVGQLPTPTPGPTPTPAPTPTPGDQPATPTPVPTPDPDPGQGSSLEEITFEPSRLDMVVGESLPLRAMGEYANGTIADITHLVIFGSRDSRTATVDEFGVVTALKSGQADIEADEPESNTSSRYDAEVIVGEMTEISLDPPQASLGVDQVLQISALASFDNGRTGVDVTARVNWSSGKRSVASVGTIDDDPGLVTGLKEGTAVISARDPDSGTKSNRDHGIVTVSPEGDAPVDPDNPPVQDPLEGELLDMSFEPTSLALLAGDSAQIRVNGIFEDGSIRDITDHVILDVRDDSVGTHTASGVILGLGEGSTNIRAEEPISGRRSSVRLPLQVAGIVSLSISPLEIDLETGTTLQLLAEATYGNGADGLNRSSLVEWTCSDPEVATVDASGLLSAIGPGDCKVSAYDASSKVSSNEVRVNVTGEPVPPPVGDGDPDEFMRLRFEPSPVFLIENDSGTVKVFAVFGDGHEEDVTDTIEFRSRNHRVARVDQGGAIQTFKAGTAQVKVIDDVNDAEEYFTVVVVGMSDIRINPGTMALRVGTEIQITAEAHYESVETVVDVTSEVGFRSSRRQVADVEEREDGTTWVRGLSEGTALIQGKHQEQQIKTDPSTGFVTVVDELVSIKVSPTKRALAPGATSRYKAKGNFGGGVRVEMADVIWTSLDPSIASVDEQGRVTGHSFGATQIVATHEETGVSSADTSSEANAVVVGALTGLQVGTSSSRFPSEPVDLTLAAGETKELKGLAKYDGQDSPFSIGSKLDWTSDNPVAVAVDARGQVSCASIGAAIISAVDPITGISTTATLGDATVTCAGAVQALVIEPPYLELDYARTRQVRAYRLLENGDLADVTRSVVWSTSEEKFAPITETGSSGGRVTGAEVGSVTITAFDEEFGVSSTDPGGVSLTVDVVKIPTSLYIEAIDGSLSGSIGERIRLRARVTYRGGATEGLNEGINWTSSDPSTVRLGPDKPNWAHLLKSGSATITGGYPGYPQLDKTLEITVLP